MQREVTPIPSRQQPTGPQRSPRRSPPAAPINTSAGLPKQSRSLTSFKLHLTVPRVLLQALLLVDDDVLDVLHGQVVSEGVEENVLQLLQGDLLHVELQRGGWGGGSGGKR